MKRTLRSAVVGMMTLLLLVTASRTQATPLTRDQFDFLFNPQFFNPQILRTFDFGPAGAGTLTDGIVSVTATLDDAFSLNTFVPSSAIESAAGAGIRLDFSPQPGGRIWGLGIDFFDSTDSVHQPSVATLKVFSVANVLLDTVNIVSLDAPFVGVREFPFFPFTIGYAIITSDYYLPNFPNDPHYAPLRIDNVKFVQTIAMPEPATLTLTALGLAGVVRRYRRRSPKA